MLLVYFFLNVLTLFIGDERVVGELIKYPLIEAVLKNLDNSTSPSLTSASLRILVTLLSVRPMPSLVKKRPQIISILDRLLSLSSTSAPVLSQCCKLVPLLAPTRTSVGYLSHLVPSLAARIAILLRQYRQSGCKVISLESSISALAHIITPDLATQILTMNPHESSKSGIIKLTVSVDRFLEDLIQLTRDEEPELRLSAVELLIRLQMNVNSSSQQQFMSAPLLPALVPIFDLIGTDARVSLALAYICRDDEKSAAMAVEVGVVKRILTMLRSTDLTDWNKGVLVANCLLALAGIGLHKDSFRANIIDNDGLTFIVKIMSLKKEEYERSGGEIALAALRKMKVAACHVLRSLSRSVPMLRTNLATEEIVDGIIELFGSTSENKESLLSKAGKSEVDSLMLEEKEQNNQEDLEVKAAIMAAICNLILDFSPLQKTMLDRGILDLIVEGAHSSYAPLRLNSVWALKQTLFRGQQQIKDVVLNKVTCSYLLELCHDQELQVQEQAMDFIRNLVSKNNEIVEVLFKEIGREQLFNLIEEKLTGKTCFERGPQLLSSTIYILVNLATGPATHRDYIVSRDSLLQKLLPLMNHENAEIRTSIIWLIINLTWVEGGSADIASDGPCRTRAIKLVELGFKQKLDERTRDSQLDVRERTKTALFQIEGLVGDTIVDVNMNNFDEDHDIDEALYNDV